MHRTAHMSVNWTALSSQCSAPVSAPWPECGQIPGLFVRPENVPFGTSP